MKFSRNFFLILVIFILSVGNAFSQISDVRYKKGTLFYYIHTIKKNESLGAIAVAYNVSVKEILEVNSAISDPEKIIDGQKINVPDYSRFINDYPNDSWSFILYRIRQGDKLKSIAKEYKTDADDIKKVNQGIDNKPTVGSEIRIPVPKSNLAQNQQDNKKKPDDKKKPNDSRENPALSFNWGNDKKDDKKEDKKNSDCRRYTYKTGTTFNISIIVPLKTNEGINDYNGVSFLQGALIAVDEMKDNGLTIKLNIFDAGIKSNISKILDSKELKESQLIIAPLSLSDLSKVSLFAQNNKIPMVVPHESKAHTMVTENPYFIQIYPSDDAIYQKLTSKQYNTADIYPILIRPATTDSVMLQNYRNALKTRYGTFVEHTHTMGLKMRDLDLKNILNKDKHNLVFVCSNTESFVSDLLDRVNILQYPISVYGRERWRDFRNINRSVFFDVNLHLVQPCFVDYNDDRVKQFVHLYRMAYKDEPGGYAFQGYDILYYFSATLKKYGPSFTGCFTDFNSTLLQSQYKIKQNKTNDGFVNDGCFLLEYTSDIEIKRE